LISDKAWPKARDAKNAAIWPDNITDDLKNILKNPAL